MPQLNGHLHTQIPRSPDPQTFNKEAEAERLVFKEDMTRAQVAAEQSVSETSFGR